MAYLVSLIVGGNGDAPPSVQCDYMDSKHSAYFDLSSLRGTMFSIDDLHGTFTYKLSLCQNVDLQPLPACAKSTSLPTAAPTDVTPPDQGPAYQLATDSAGSVAGCFRLGTLAKSSWSLIDDDDPEKGVELTYGGGERCSGTRDREIRFHFICADGFPKDSPPMFAFETTEYCHYNVTWPTILACPTYHSAFAWSSTIVKAIFVTLILYFVFGCMFYHFQHKREWGWDSMPNAGLWAVLVDAIANKATCLSCLKRTGEHGEGDDEGSASTQSTDADDFERRFPMKKDQTTTATTTATTAAPGAPGGSKTKK